MIHAYFSLSFPMWVAVKSLKHDRPVCFGVTVGQPGEEQWEGTDPISQ